MQRGYSLLLLTASRLAASSGINYGSLNAGSTITRGEVPGQEFCVDSFEKFSALQEGWDSAPLVFHQYNLHGLPAASYFAISGLFVWKTLFVLTAKLINPLPPSDSETEKFISEDLFSSVLSELKKYQPSGNLKFNNLGILKSLKIA